MIEHADSNAAAAETHRMIREEVILRPARRAAIFCALVIVGLTGFSIADGGQIEPAPAGAGFEIRAELR
jgi:hypothetical protein